MSGPPALDHWLAEEVWGLFQSGPVGLYEFVEFPNSDFRPAAAADLSPQEQRMVARAALHKLLSRGGYELKWAKWASEYDRPATLADVSDMSWDTPTEEPYLVIAERSGAR